MDVEFPAKLQGLFKPARYKILYGGRGGAKSWGIARALLLQAARDPLRVVCGREHMGSIRESVYKLLKDQITALGLGGLYEVQANRILGANGSEFSFHGLKHNIANIKSLEGADRVWVEEADNVSAETWQTLIPTVRKEGSEIWVSFNPQLESDDTYQRFVLYPPKTAWVQQITWQDNPWFPRVLEEEREALKAKDEIKYQHVWEGHCLPAVTGAVYAKELAQARIQAVPYYPGKPVHRFWDLGWSDKVAIWYAQAVGLEFRVLRYTEGQHRTIADYLREGQGFEYVYGTDWLPHDARAKTLAADGQSIEQKMRGQGCTVKIVPSLSILDGIDALREFIPRAYFDKTLCADGLYALRHYQWKPGAMSREPLHDENSHAADAARMMAVAMKEEKADVKPPLPHFNLPLSWLGA